jgi:hypothetical protein
MKTLIHAAIRCSLMFTAVATLSIVYPAKANLITNPGFETGDFTGWAHVGGDVDGTNPHSGNFAAIFFNPGDLRQSVATKPGASYTIDFFLAHTGTPLFNFFAVSWGGETIFVTDSAAADYDHLQFIVTASDPSTELRFDFSPNFGGQFWSLDDVIVTRGVGAPDAGSTFPLLGFALLGLAALRRKLSC